MRPTYYRLAVCPGMAGAHGVELDADGWLPRVSTPVVEAVIVAVALVLGSATLLTWYWLDVDPFDAFVVGLPAALVITILVAVRHSSPPELVYSEMLRGTLLGLFSLGGFIGGVLAVQETSLVEGLPLLLFMMGFGAVAGILVGYSRGQNREAERKSTRLERQQDRIEFLNQLLRHNVLNKVAIIKGNAELLEEEYDLEDPALSTIIDQSENVSELVENVRVLVSSFTSQASLHPVDLSAELRAEVESIGQAFEDAEIDADVPAGLVVSGDGLLRYVFENVLHNAIVHNDAEAPTVEVTAERRDETVVVTVRDNGSGIPTTVEEGVADSEVTGNHGVGLYLVDTLVTEYGGSMDIDDNEPRGSEVRLRFQAVGEPSE